MAKQVVYLAPGILAKLDADPAIRQAVLALMERDAELAAKTGQPIRADPQRARPIIATGSCRGLFEALKKGVPTASFSPPVVRVCDKWTAYDWSPSISFPRVSACVRPLSRLRRNAFSIAVTNFASTPALEIDEVRKAKC